MKPNLKKANKPTIVAVSLLTIAGLGLSQFVPAWAGRPLMAKALIDPELETALANHFKKRFFNLIDASEEQKTKLSSLITKQQDFARPIREQIRDKVMDLSDLMSDEAAGDEAIKAKVHEIQDLRNQIQDKRLDTMLEVRSVLTAEQKKIVSKRIKNILTGNVRGE